MCLAIPAKILKIKNNKAIVDYLGEEREMDGQLIKDIKIGDYAIASNGFLVKKISAQEAEEIFNIIRRKQ
jgi:hydrogenase expression/formation protein HypC